jgi:hypothetical protein
MASCIGREGRGDGEGLREREKERKEGRGVEERGGGKKRKGAGGDCVVGVGDVTPTFLIYQFCLLWIIYGSVLVSCHPCFATNIHQLWLKYHVIHTPFPLARNFPGHVLGW